MYNRWKDSLCVKGCTFMIYLFVNWRRCCRPICVMNTLVTRLAHRHVHSHSNRLPVNERQTYETLLIVMTCHRIFCGNCLSILFCNAAAVTGGCRMSHVCDTASVRERVCERGVSLHDAVSL